MRSNNRVTLPNRSVQWTMAALAALSLLAGVPLSAQAGTTDAGDKIATVTVAGEFVDIGPAVNFDSGVIGGWVTYTVRL